LTESTWCCGSAGIYNITQPEMAAELQERKLRHVAETGASIVATANPGCILQLESGVRKFSIRVAVRHRSASWPKRIDRKTSVMRQK
jgi:glycolate oxidase iron-sulfur subunit